MFVLLGVLSGCGRNVKEHHVLAITSTVIGAETSLDPATNQPQTSFGYNRRELALVPTNRVYCKNKKGEIMADNCEPVPEGSGGAKDSADVLMEIYYNPKDSSGIYQRLAVGEKAVKQPGAWLMFTKDPEGTVNDNSVRALSKMAKLQTAEYDYKQDEKTDEIINYVANKKGELKKNDANQTLLKELFDNAKIPAKNPYRQFIEKAVSAEDLRERFKAREEFIKPLNKVIPLDYE